MLTNENNWLNKMEIFLKKLTKVHDDFIKLENNTNKRKYFYSKMKYYDKFYEKFLRLSILFITILVILYFYYFYIFVNILFINDSGISYLI